MIKEIIQFVETLSETFKASADKPSTGLHIIVQQNDKEELYISKYIFYDGVSELDEDLELVNAYEKNSSYITMNQQQKFDSKQKIHSSSPYSFAFNFSLGNPEKLKDISEQLKKQLVDKNDKTALDLLIKDYKMSEVKERIDAYFSNARKLCFKEPQSAFIVNHINAFEAFCRTTLFELLPSLEIERKIEKTGTIEKIKILPILKEKNYVRVYLGCVALDAWEKAYTTYYEREYPPNEIKENDFVTTYGSKKPFLVHKTASFREGRFLFGKEAKQLNIFKTLLAAKVLPNPLPMFIYDNEIQGKAISIYKESGNKFGYKEIIENLLKNHKKELSNYYLFYWRGGKEIIEDFDFVAKFEYELIDENGQPWEILPLFFEKRIEISNVFSFEEYVLPVIFNNALVVFSQKNNSYTRKYFGDIEEKYCKSGVTYSMVRAYRQIFYDYIYKSQRNKVTASVFDEIMKTSILESIYLDKMDGKYHTEQSLILNKLNIWFSLREKFDNNFNFKNEKTMASKLQDYQQFMDRLIKGEADLSTTQTAEFAFAAGQIISYLQSKSKSADKSYARLEPYLQQATCEGIKKGIANDFARYKHELLTKKFDTAAAFVLTFHTEENMKKYLPELLAGCFSENQLFSDKNTAEQA